MAKAKRLGFFAALFFVLGVFCYFRLKPIYFQIVPYTYDQGRDFLTAAKMIVDQKFKLTGPTTGLAGIYHGVWWFYLLTIPFLLFGGNPLGYYLFIFFLQLASAIVFAIFIYKNFGQLATLLTTLILATSPYFISNSLVISNNVLAPPFVLLFLITNFYLLKNKQSKNILLFFNGLFLGFIAESELAFGMILIPGYILLVFLIKQLREKFTLSKNIFMFMSGLIIPFLPRIVFEILRGFVQTKSFTAFLTKPSLFNPKPFTAIFQDRVNLFLDYFTRLFLNETFLLIFLVAIASFFIWILLDRQKKTYDKIYFSFLGSLIIILFISSTFYRDSFWFNYFEGVQYVFLIAVAIAVCIKTEKAPNFAVIIGSSLLVILFLYTIRDIAKSIYYAPTQPEGLKTHLETINYITSNEKNLQNYCVKIYTAPIIPYTYEYLFFHNYLAKNISQPKNDFVNGRCWYIIEIANDTEIRFRWEQANIPKTAKMLNQTIIRDVQVQLWQQ